MTYTYNLGGAMTEQQYPSGRVVKNTLDPTGDLSVVQSKKNAISGFFTYASAFSYTAAGAVSSMKLGNGKWESTTFNSRLQPTQIALGTVQNGTDKLKLEYTYNTTGYSDNNGNVLTQKITVPGMTYPLIQAYAYDSLNRLASATETSNGTQTWKQAFTYDRYGNRNFDESQTTMPSSFANPAVTDPTVSTTNNRLTSSGYSYDNAGNTLTDAGGKTYTYDAENKQVQVNTGSTIIGQYYYDGDGKRVKKYVPGTGETTIFVYDAAGKQIAEYSTIVEGTSTAKVNYLTSDHLGSPRINTDANGAIISRHDYHPFGEEIGGAGGRTTGLNYGSDAVRKQFTGYERDGETDLDFAQARMYSNVIGRFFSPDPVGPDIYTPQTLNRYSYALNNPLKFVDRDGRYEEEVHRDLTVILAYLAGFNPRQSYAIGKADQEIDTNPKTNPEIYGNVSARAEWHFTSPATRARHWSTFQQSVDDVNGLSLTALGQFLHSQQDAFSHAGFNFVTGQASSGFKDGVPLSREEFMKKAREADQTQTDPAKAERMAADTFSRLLQAAARMQATGRFGSFGRAVPLKLIEPYIKRWATAENREDKYKILQELLNAATNWRLRQIQLELEKQRKPTVIP